MIFNNFYFDCNKHIILFLVATQALTGVFMTLKLSHILNSGGGEIFHITYGGYTMQCRTHVFVTIHSSSQCVGKITMTMVVEQYSTWWM